jgi:predicted dithiol-disulfide oxidoreductase (DUF899 family)
MTMHTATREEWLAARQALLAEEKALLKARDALAEKRRALPRCPVETPYAFQGPEGPVPLAALFGGKSQLIIYHFMFGADWQEGCKSCSFWADHFDGMAPHLAARDVAFACISIAPLARLLEFRQRMGWRFNWLSSAGTTFNADFGVTGLPGETLLYNYGKPIEDAGELPGLSVFAREGGAVLHTYSCYSRGLDNLNGTYQFLDLVPKGRDESGLEWPMAWVKHHDRYGSPCDSC